MTPWILTLCLASAPEEVHLTTGWLTVLDVPHTQAAQSEDTHVAVIGSIDHDQVLLYGGEPGTTALAVTTDTGTRRYKVTVHRGSSLQPFASIVRVNVTVRRTWRVPGIERVAIGNSSICEAFIDGPDELVLMPRQSGTTPLVIWTHGADAKHRREVLLTSESGGISRTVDDVDAVQTDPLDGRLGMIAGELALIDLPPETTHVAIADESVVRLAGSATGELKLQARRAGATHLHLWRAGGRRETRFIVVHAHSPWEWEIEIGDPVPDEPGPVPQAITR